MNHARRPLPLPFDTTTRRQPRVPQQRLLGAQVAALWLLVGVLGWFGMDTTAENDDDA